MKSLIINKKDLKENVNIIKNIAEETSQDDKNKSPKIIGVVKGNGYGLGLVKYAKFLIENGIDFLAVSTVEEAIQLRRAGIYAKILMLSSTSIKREINLLIKNDIILTIGSKKAGDIAESIAKYQKKEIKIHIKIDTGFGRYGFCYNQKEEMLNAIKEWENLKIEGTCSHFSLAFYKKDKYSKQQFDNFINCIEYLKENGIETGILHICNSSAFLKYKDMRLDAVRIGSAFLGRISIPNIYGLRKIGYLKSNITEIKTLPKGYNIGYSNSYITKKETLVATIPTGYADGFNVSVQRDMYRKRDKLRYIIRDIKDIFKDKNIYVEINGKKYRVLGRVGMYHISIDITGTEIKLNQEVIMDIKPFYVDSNIRREYI